MHNIRKVAAVLALALSLAIPGSAFADTGSGATNETLNIPAEYTLSNVPTTITYTQSGDANAGYAPSNTALAFSGSAQFAGQALSENAGYISIGFASSFGSGTSLFVTSSDLTGGYPNDIAATDRIFTGMGPSGGIEGSSPILNGSLQPVSNSDPLLIASWDGTTTGASVGFRPVVTVAGGSVGTFTGTLTFTVVGN